MILVHLALPDIEPIFSLMSKPYNPNTQGWGFALVVCVLTGGLFYGAYSIHAATYRHPRDPMAVQVYSERDSVLESGSHSEGGDHGGEKADDHGDDH